MATEHSAEITQAISRFEAAWADGATPRLEEFIPQEIGENVELVAELVAVDLERRLKAGKPIRLEDYLDRFPRLAAAPVCVVSLIIAEFQHRCRSNPALSADEYLERFPQYRKQLLAQLAATEETQIGSEQFVTETIRPATKEVADGTADGLLRRMVELGLVSQQTVETRRKSLPAAAQQDQHLINELLKQGDVTAWQLKQLRAGQKTFVLEHGRYLLLDELGKGGMGSVYRARHIGLNRDVALKTIDPRQAKNKQLVGRFQREIAVCAKLQHEHIVQAYDMGCHENVHFLVLEYVQGADLASIVKRDGALPPAEVAAIGLQIAAALVYAHAQGIVHRDIKPHNILLSTDGVSKLLDLGLASNAGDTSEAEALTSLTQTGMILGTADYMPPEQAADLSRVDCRSDIYSLGATLYYLLTGHPPFPGGDMMSKLHRLANAVPAPIGQLRPDCPREFSTVVEKMLAKRPEQRYQSTVEVLHALKPLAAVRISGRPVMTRAIQTASETQLVGASHRTTTDWPFDFMIDRPLSETLRLQRTREVPRWAIKSAAALLLVIPLIVWGVGIRGARDNLVVEQPLPKEILPPPKPVYEKRPPLDVRLRQRPGHFGAVGTVAFSPDGARFLSAANDGEIRVWNAQTMKTEAIYRGHRGVPETAVWFQDGRQIASVDTTNQVHLWSPFSGEQLEVVDNRIGFRVGYQNVIAASPDGSELAFRGPSGIIRWDIKRKQVIQELPGTIPAVIEYSPTGRFLAASDHNKITIWDLASKSKMPQQSLPLPLIQRPGTANYIEFQMIDDDRIAIAGDGYVEFRDVQDGKLLRTIEVPKTGARYDRFLRLSSNARFLIVMQPGGKTHRVDLATGATTTHSFALQAWPSRVSLSPNATLQAFRARNSRPRYLQLYNYLDNSLKTTGKTEFLYFNNSSVDDRSRVIGQRFLFHAGYAENDSSDAWDLATGRLLNHLPSQSTPAYNIDDELLLLCNDHVERWPMTPGATALDVWPKLEGLAEAPITQAQGRWGWAENGKLIWANTPGHKSARIWETRSGKLLKTFSAEQAFFTIFRGSRFYLRTRTVFGADDVPGGRVTECEIAPVIGTPNSSALKLRIAGVTSTRNICMAGDSSRICLLPGQISPRVVVHDVTDGDPLAEFAVPADIEFAFIYQYEVRALGLSQSGRYLLLYDRVYDLDADSDDGEAPPVLWQAAPHSSAYYESELLGDEQHLLMRLGDRYELWDWRNNRKRSTLYLLPDKQWMLCNHETGCWISSKDAFQHIEFLSRDEGGKEEWVLPPVYEERTGWSNDPAKVGLSDLLGE